MNGAFSISPQTNLVPRSNVPPFYTIMCAHGLELWVMFCSANQPRARDTPKMVEIGRSSTLSGSIQSSAPGQVPQRHICEISEMGSLSYVR